MITQEYKGFKVLLNTRVLDMIESKTFLNFQSSIM